MAEERNTYDAEVREVFSGDDLVVLVDLGVESLWKRQRVRLAGVDTPNAISAGMETEAGKIRSYVRQLVRGKHVKITVTNRSSNSWVVILFVETPEGIINLNEDLIKQGYQFKR